MRKRDFFSRFSVDLLGRAATVALVLLAARRLAVADFGRLAFAMTYANVLYLFMEAGLHLPFMKEMGPLTGRLQEGRALWREFFGLRLAATSAVAVAGTLIAPWIWPWEGLLVIIAMVGWVAGNAMADFFHLSCTVAGRLDASAGVVLGHRLFCVVGVLGGLLAGKTLLWTALGYGAGSLAGAAAGWTVLLRATPFAGAPAFRFPRAAAWFRTGGPFAAGSVMDSLHGKLGVFLLPWLGYGAALGTYGGAHKIFELCALLPAAFISLALPHLSRTMESRPDRLRPEMLRLGLSMLALSLTVIIAGEAAAPLGIRLLLGARFGEAAPLLRILLLANALAFMNYYLSHLLILFHRGARHMKNEALCLAASAGAGMFLVSRAGAAGAAWTVVLAEALLLPLTLWALKEPWRRLHATMAAA